MVFETLLDPIFSPLLNLPTLLSVIIMSFLISLIITVIYKYTTDQNLMKQLKLEMKEYQKKIKESRSQPEKAMQLQKEAMQSNMKYMKHSMRSTLYSFLPIILIFGWMTANLAYEPILPNKEFSIKISFEDNVNGFVNMSLPEGIKTKDNLSKEIRNKEVEWTLSGEKGEYLIEYFFNEKKYDKQVVISEKKYKEPVKMVNDGTVKEISIGYNKNVLINIFGWKIGWLGTYIILAIVFSIIIRKLMKVY